MNIQGMSQGGQVNCNVSEVKGDNNPVIAQTQTQIQTQVEQETNGFTELTKNSVENLTKKLDNVVSDYGVHAEYEMHDKLKDVMIRIIDDKTGDVISELPPKKILDMIAKFCEMAGIIVDKKA